MAPEWCQVRTHLSDFQESPGCQAGESALEGTEPAAARPAGSPCPPLPQSPRPSYAIHVPSGELRSFTNSNTGIGVGGLVAAPQQSTLGTSLKGPPKAQWSTSCSEQGGGRTPTSQSPGESLGVLGSALSGLSRGLTKQTSRESQRVSLPSSWPEESRT